MLTNLNLIDAETGYKAFKASLMRSSELQEDRLGVLEHVKDELASTFAVLP